MYSKGQKVPRQKSQSFNNTNGSNNFNEFYHYNCKKKKNVNSEQTLNLTKLQTLLKQKKKKKKNTAQCFSRWGHQGALGGPQNNLKEDERKKYAKP